MQLGPNARFRLKRRVPTRAPAILSLERDALDEDTYAIQVCSTPLEQQDVGNMDGARGGNQLLHRIFHNSFDRSDEDVTAADHPSTHHAQEAFHRPVKSRSTTHVSETPQPCCQDREAMLEEDVADTEARVGRLLVRIQVHRTDEEIARAHVAFQKGRAEDATKRVEALKRGNNVILAVLSAVLLVVVLYVLWCALNGAEMAYAREIRRRQLSV